MRGWYYAGIGFLAALALTSLALCGTGARAETKVTVGVGHMCCAGCKTKFLQRGVSA